MRITTCVLALVAATLPACASKSKKPEPMAGTGVLRLASAPAAEVVVDGQTVGTTPLTHEVSAGSHTIVLRAAAFRDLSAEVDVTAGKTWEKTWVLTPQDPSDPVAIRTLAASFELTVVDLEPAVRARGFPDPKRVVPLYPRGDVRLSDLEEFRVETGAEFEPDGTLAFRRGKRELHAKPFAPAGPITIAVFPDAVQAGLKPGASITWGYYPSKGKAVTAKFKLVRDDPRLQKRLAQMQKRLAGKPDLVVYQMRAQLYLNKRLYLAAYLEARKAFEQSKHALQAIAVMQSALRRMRLDETSLWDEVQKAAADAPPRGKARLRR